MFTLPQLYQLKTSIEDGQRKGASLFRIAMGFEPELCRKIRETYRTLDDKYKFYYAKIRVAVWMADFFNEAKGNDFWKVYDGPERSEDPEYIATNGEKEKIWREVYREDQNLDRDTFLSKCWALNTVESRHGEHSKVWAVWKKCMAKAVHSYRNYREIQFGGENREESKWLDLLLRTNSNERRDFLLVLQWLASGEEPDGISNDDPLRLIHTACQGQIANNAWCDWYLMLEGDQARFGIGFDDYPRNNRKDWRHFLIDGYSDSIFTKSACFVSAPFDRGVEVEYCGERWNTAEDKESGHPVFPLRDVPIGIFVRYRAESNKDIQRKNWWREADKWWITGDKPPELGRSQSEILICVREDGDMNALTVELSDGIRLEKDEGEERRLTFHDSDGRTEATCFAKIFRVTERPDNKQGEIIFKYNGQKQCSFTVCAKKPELDVKGNDDGFELENPKDRVLAFPGQPLELQVKNFREDRTYEWLAHFEGRAEPVWRQQGLNIRFLFRDVLPQEQFEELNVLAWRIECRDVTDGTRGASIGSVKGLLLPNAVYGALKSKHHQCPANWTAVIPDVNPISGWIEGKTRIALHHLGEEFSVLVPQTQACWWFQKRHEHIDRTTGEISAVDFNGRKYFTCGDSLPELTLSDMDTLELCRPEMPGFDRSSAEWHFWQGYWYCGVRELVRVAERDEEFRFNPQAEPRVWKSREGTGFFQYPPMAAGNTCLCKDVQGTIGLYVAAGDDVQYDVFAISDKSPDLFLKGEHLLQAHGGEGFTPLQESWDAFCEKTTGADAILCALPHREDSTSFFQGVMGSKLPPKMCICHHAEQDPFQGYEDEIGPLAPILKKCVGPISETHPLCNMRFWNYERRPTLEATRKSWELQVSALCDGSDCHSSEAWKKLFSEWRAVGFHPALEGIEFLLVSLAWAGYLRLTLPVPAPSISQNQWFEFLQWLGDYKDPYDTREFKKRLNELGYNATSKRINIAKGWKTRFDNTKKAFEKLMDEGFPVTLFPMVSCEGAVRALGRMSISALASHFAGKLPNNVGSGELILETGNPPGIQFPEGGHVTPEELVMSIQTGDSCDPRKEFLATLLHGMGQEGRRAVRVSGRNEWCDTPTDREWLFCLASSLSLLHSKATLEDGARTILTQILDWLDGRPDGVAPAPGKKTPNAYFKEYAQLVATILNLPQIRERMP